MKILILNPNTSASMTAEILSAAAAVAAPGTEIVRRAPQFGSVAIDSAAESYLSAVGVMDIAAEAAEAVSEDGADVIVLGCAGLAQAVVNLGLTTSKPGVYAPGPPNPRTYWPLSSALGLDL